MKYCEPAVALTVNVLWSVVDIVGVALYVALVVKVVSAVIV